MYSQSDTLFATQVDIFANCQLQVISEDTAMGYLDAGSHFVWEGVDFGTGVDSVDIRLVAHPDYISQFIVTIDALDGDTILMYTPTTTGDWYTYEIQSFKLLTQFWFMDSISGIHDLYVQSSGVASGNIHWMVFYPDNKIIVEDNKVDVELKWNPSTDNVGVEGYNLWIDAEFYATTPDTSYIFRLDSGKHAVAVSAFDLAGNESDQSLTLFLIVGDEEVNSFIAVYPNPNFGTFSVILTKQLSTTSTLQLLTPTGKLIQENTVIWKDWSHIEVFDGGSLELKDSVTNLEGLHDSYWREDDYYKREIFTATETYEINRLDVPLFKTGTGGDIEIEILEIIGENEVVKTVSTGYYEAINLGPSSEFIWHTVPLTTGTIEAGKKYAIQLHALSPVDDNNRVGWHTNTADDPDHYLMYTYDDMVTWGRNDVNDYMFKLWGGADIPPGLYVLALTLNGERITYTHIMISK
jgi:hypothetical protein